MHKRGDFGSEFKVKRTKRRYMAVINSEEVVVEGYCFNIKRTINGFVFQNKDRWFACELKSGYPLGNGSCRGEAVRSAMANILKNRDSFEKFAEEVTSRFGTGRGINTRSLR